MAIDLNQLRVFVTVVETGAMTRAAKVLKMPISRVSRTIARLEITLAATLITRTTRTLQVSDAGKRLYQSSLPLMRRLSEIEHEFSAFEEAMAGKIRITAPEDIGGSIIAPILSEISSSNPNLSLELICTDERLDMVQSSIDIGLRMGKLADSSLKAKKIGNTHMICVAAPSYLQRAEELREPRDLSRHACIELRLGSAESGSKWELFNGRNSVRVGISPRLMCNNTRAAISFAIARHGIAMVPSPMVIDYIRSSDLTRVLPQWTGKVIPVHLIQPAQRTVAPRVRTVYEHLERRLAGYFGEH